MSCEPSSSKHHHHSHHLHVHRRRHISYDDHEVSMLLDPAYTRPRSSSSQTRVYKDHRGDLHDPDYRHFPSTSTYPTSSSSSRRSKRVNSGASSIARPSWESGLGEGMDDEEFEAYYNDGEDIDAHYSSSRLPTRSYSPRYSSRTSPSYIPYSPSSTSSSTSSSPSSFTSTLSDSDLSYYPSSTPTTSSSCPTHKFTKRLLSRNTHSHTHRSSFVEEHVHPSEVDSVSEDQEDSISLPEESEREMSASPTGSLVSTSDAMRKQWQATKLSVQFGVFRAQRKVKQALAGKR
ncbi:hypothetical protein E1B28_009368 [Marasmius oreades]|uniref:Uncharacterized protein n=1 Tax=Marasmius oreades TaxID=181124 RepID=A0A9P7UTC8_9AGAR|nr:uncharacterized protein E1B28_009368 [Marasmius oreades]KAG7093080.1 hypothetical protein E1B28_009368 [Marasmius oreades]